MLHHMTTESGEREGGRVYYYSLNNQKLTRMYTGVEKGVNWKGIKYRVGYRYCHTDGDQTQTHCICTILHNSMRVRGLGLSM